MQTSSQKCKEHSEECSKSESLFLFKRFDDSYDVGNNKRNKQKEEKCANVPHYTVNGDQNGREEIHNCGKNGFVGNVARNKQAKQYKSDDEDKLIWGRKQAHQLVFQYDPENHKCTQNRKEQ